MYENDYNEEPRQEGRGRTAKKRAAKAIEDLAWRLTELKDADLAKLAVSAPVREELDLARSIKGHGARKRQIKHLAGLLRRSADDSSAVEDFFSGLDSVHLEERRLFHHLEELRERLCQPENSAEALDEAFRSCPGIDRKALARLVRSVQNSGDKKAYREIFRQLRQACSQD